MTREEILQHAVRGQYEDAREIVELKERLAASEARAEKAEAALERADLLAGSVEMGLGSDHATIKRMCHFYRKGLDLPCNEFKWPTRAALKEQG